MASEKYDFISDIDTFKSSWKLKVRVLSLWKTKYELQMIVMDEKCNKIGAVIKQALFSEFENQLEESAVYVLSSFGVGDNKGMYPVYHHKLKLNFYRNTILQRVSSFDGPLNAFDFLPFTQVFDKKDEPILFVDVIGKVVDCGDLVPYEKKDGKEGKRMKIQLEDNDNIKLDCTFWDQWAFQMHDFVAQNTDQNDVVLIIQFGKIQYWSVTKELSIQNAYFGTKLHINSDVPEVMEFRKLLSSRIGMASSSQGGSQLSSKVHSFRDDFLTMPKMNIGEIIDATKAVTCVVLATITCVEERNGWNYIGCRKCKKKVIKKSVFVEVDKEKSEENNGEDDGILYCTKCNDVASSVIPCYKVQVRVQDGSGTTSFVIFDREMTKLLRRTASEVREQQLIQDEDPVDFPAVFQSLKEKRLLFMVNVSSYNIDTVYNVYTVLKICNDPSLMAEFDNNQPGNDDQDVDNGGVFVKAGNTNKECSLTKDVASFTDDSSNALDITSQTAQSPLKRQIEAVDVETIGDNSTTKKKMFVEVKIEK